MIQLPLPQEEIILPVTGKQIRVYPLTVKHKLMIAESELLTMSSRLKFIAEIAYDRIVDKELFQNNYETFLRNVYEADIEAIYYGIMKATYKKPVPFVVTCPKCGYINEVEVPVEQLIKNLRINQGGQDKYYLDQHKVDVEEFGLTFILKLPTLYDIIRVFEFAEQNNFNILKESVKADSLEALMLKLAPYSILAGLVMIQTSDGQVVRNDTSSPALMRDCLEVLFNLTEDVLARLHEFISNLKAKYAYEFGFQYICKNPQCESHKKKEYIEADVDILSQFFPIPIEKLLQEQGA
jgi:hypothetical protein